MRGREIKEIASSPIGMYIRNTSDIMPNWSDICNIADIPKLSDMQMKRIYWYCDNNIKEKKWE